MKSATSTKQTLLLLLPRLLLLRPIAAALPYGRAM
jgi:hypothetical protein